MRLILASTSPRRRDLLARIGAVPDRVEAPDIDETPLKGELPRPYALRLAEAKARFAPRGWVVAIAAPVGNADWNMHAYARVTDKIFLMAYDEHEMSGPAGPIASQRWFARSVANAAVARPIRTILCAFVPSLPGATSAARPASVTVIRLPMFRYPRVIIGDTGPAALPPRHVASPASINLA